MNLDDTQTARVREWIDQGLKVADIQSRLADELGVRMTYMEARLLLDDLRLRPKDAPAAAARASDVLAGAAAPQPGGPRPVPSGPGAGAGGASLTLQPEPLPAGGGRVSVSVDDLARPGALVSGKVVFRDGQAAEWQLDQYGRLAVVPKTPGYKPPQSDVVDFQTELESVLARLGY